MKSLAQGHEDNKRHKRVGEVCECVLEAVVDQHRETNVLQAVPWDSETQSFRVSGQSNHYSREEDRGTSREAGSQPEACPRFRRPQFSSTASLQ